MNVLLAEVDIPYDLLYDLDEINHEFAGADVAVVVGANDVVNPAAQTAEGTPIYGMPVLHVHEAGRVVVCNLDRGPGYAGVPNSLYDLPQCLFVEGSASETLQQIIDALAGRS
jgi:NAD(P) transhydrogenase subunit beta